MLSLHAFHPPVGEREGNTLPPAFLPALAAYFFTIQSTAMQIQDNSLAAEINGFMRQVFTNCQITSQFYPEHQAWKFQLSFTASKTASYHICPPKGCCLMKVHQIGQKVYFNITVFVEQFATYHLQKIAN